MINELFYTYLHRRKSDGLIFYIGKGRGDRATWPHGRSQYWSRVVKKHGFFAEICAKWPSEKEAFEHEKFLIWCFKDMGHKLVNMTEGGDGPSGYVHTEETKKLLSKRMLDRMAIPGNLEKLKDIRKHQWTDEAKAKASRSSRNVWDAEGTREHHSKILKDAYSSPEKRQMQKDKSPIVQRRPDVEEKRKTGVQRYWESYKANPEKHLSRSEIVKRGWETRRKLNAHN
jgi:hypothetical protein